MKQHILPALRLTVVCLVFFCALYPLSIWLVAQATPSKGLGETVSANGRVVGYALIGQKFDDVRYFQSRPSAVVYNAAGSAGSNKGPTNPDYLAQVQERINQFKTQNPEVALSDIPSELVTASGSGLDPDISPKAALVQAKRIAQVRHLPEEKIENVIKEHTQKPLLGMFGTERINVLKLNLALDELK